MISLSDFASRLQKVRQTGRNQYMACCPVHDDRTQSLAFGEADNGGIKFLCHAGCDKREILSRIDLTFADVSPAKKEMRGRFDYQNIVATYEYRNGTRKLRDAYKNFTWQHLENGQWVNRRGDALHVLFTSGEVQDTAYVVEGEKDALNLSKCGYYCVSSENGAGGNSGGRKWFPSYNSDLRGKTVRIIPDYDDAGRAFAELVAAEVVTVADSVKVFDLSRAWPEIQNKQDISDMIAALGVEEVVKRITHLERTTDEWTPAARTMDDQSVAENQRRVYASLAKTTVRKNGRDTEQVLNTSENFLKIFEGDARFSDVRFNTMRGLPERVRDGKRVPWTDADDAAARTYIESVYGIFNRQKFDDGLSVFVHRREYHPVQARINQIVWDGEQHCEMFLIKWMGVADNAYNRECSRLLFAGGINRAYRPGCKFDDVIVLIGAQGGGKSTLCRWLALEDDFYSSLKTISGQKGYEAIQGVWVAEIEELLAVLANDKQGSKVEESAKAFLSTQSDYYRRPYDRRSAHNPRHCFFIGTTNRSTFLTDKTGNRRWYPVRCNMTGAELYAREQECKSDILQCWAEMLHAYKAGEPLAKPTAQVELLSEIKSQQTDAEVEDYRTGLFEEYLQGKRRVCLIELWKKVIYKDSYSPPPMTRKDSNEIAEILVNQLGWERGSVASFGEYGRQKAFLCPDGVAVEWLDDDLPL